MQRELDDLRATLEAEDKGRQGSEKQIKQFELQVRHGKIS